MTMRPLDIQRIRVRKGALDIDVACALDALRVTEEQAALILALCPNLASHVCVNGAGDGTFGDELVGTELPHLLEHLVIELQGSAYAIAHANSPKGEAPSFTGHTSWLEELDVTAPHGFASMRVTVSFANDFTALAALNEALGIIIWALDPHMYPQPDVDAVVNRLAAR